MISCCWFVSRSVAPWERELIESVAEAARSRVDLKIYVDGGDINHALSWNALSGFERLGIILKSGVNFWHLWGAAPSWWWVIKLRARSVHTAFSDERLSGYPTRFLQARKGEAVILPTFSASIGHVIGDDDNQDDTPRVVCLARENLLSDLPAGCVALTNNASGAMRAAAYTMLGAVVIAVESSYLDALLGPDGYVHVKINNLGDQAAAWSGALAFADTDKARASAAAARHFIKTHFTAERSAESLLAVYSRVLAK